MADMIEIALLRVSADSLYLEFSVNCPATYEFNKLYITKYNVNTKAWETITHDASTLLPAASNSVVMRIAMTAFSAITYPDTLNNTNVTMYEVTFGATPNAEGIAEGLTEPIEMVGLCSNINFLYANLLDLVMRLTNCCMSEQDYNVLDRNHMILYAHTEAMRLGRKTEAIFFYDIIWSLFVSCGPTVRQSGISNKPCNCD